MGLDLNPIHAVEHVVGDAKNAFDEVTSGAHTAPTPQVNSSPPETVQPQVWTAPAVGGSGHITVHRDALVDASDIVRKHLPELDAAINRVNSHSNAFDSLMTWATGSSFGGNLISAVEGFATTSQQTSDAHSAVAQNLSDTAATYEDAESTNTQAARNVGSQPTPSGGSPSGGSPSGGSASGGSSSAASGNWS